MVNFRPIIVSLLLVGLFAICMITAGIQIATVNNANQSIGDDAVLAAYASSMNSSLEATVSAANTTEDAISSSPITLTSGFPVFDSITGVWKTLKVIPVTIYNLTFGLVFGRLLGGGVAAIVVGVIGSILTITIILSVWKMVSTGESG